MKRKLIFSLSALLMFLSLSAFQCSSTELTSAKLYIQQKNYPKAMEALQKEIQKNPKSDEGYYLLGYLQGEEGNYKDMKVNLDKSLEISKKFEKNIEDLKRAHWASNFNKGVSFFNKAAKVSSEDSIKTYFDKAIVSFQNSILLEPDSADTYKNLAFALIQANRQDESIEPLEKLVKMNTSADSYTLLGRIYSDKGNTQMAKYKSSKSAQDSLAAVDYYNKAIDVLEMGRKRFPEDQDILYFLSNAYISANKTQVAMETFKTGVEKEPDNQFYRYNYGTLLLQANRYAEAEEQFKKAIEVDPEYHNALYNLAVTYVKWGTSLREAADKKGADDPQIKEKYQAALPILQKAIEIKPDDSLTWETIAKVYAVLGMSKESKDAFDKADQYRK